MSIRLELAAVPVAVELLAVAGHPGLRVDDGLAPAGKPVDQGGLADVREADDGDAGRPGSSRQPSLARASATTLRDDLVRDRGRSYRARSSRRPGAARRARARGRARRARAGRPGPASTARRSRAARRRARSASSATRKTLSGASGLTTVPMSRPSATYGPPAISSRWRATIAVAHARMDRDPRGGGRDLGRRGSPRSRPRRPARPLAVEGDLEPRSGHRGHRRRRRPGRAPA